MEEKVRAKKDIDKLKKLVYEFSEAGLDKKYPEIYGYVKNYLTDAIHFFENKDYFTAFGATNYAHGFMDTVLIIEGKKK